MRRLSLGLALAAFLAGPALAQVPYPAGPDNQSSLALIAPTPPTAANNNQIATTAWVNTFVNAGLPLASGKIFIGSVGNIATAQTPTGDWTISTAGLATLATVNGNVGSFGSATSCITTTQNAKGLTTAISAATCTPALGSITGLGTGVATALATNIGTAGAPVVLNSLGGTPASITLTNATGLPTTALTGVLQAAQEPAHTGDCTNSASSLALTCLNTNGVAFTTNATAAVGQLPGEPSNGTAAAGKVGQILVSNVGSGSAVSLTTSTALSITSITLTAGDWDVYCYVGFVPAASTSVTQEITSISTTNNTLDVTTAFAFNQMSQAAQVPAGLTTTTSAGPVSFQVTSTQQVFVVARAIFTASTMTAYGGIRARRMR